MTSSDEMADADRERAHRDCENCRELFKSLKASDARLTVTCESLALAVAAMKSIETLHTPGDIKDWGPHECFAKCQSIARHTLAKIREKHEVTRYKVEEIIGDHTIILSGPKTKLE